MNWAAEQRQIYIKNHIEEYGSINRSDLMDFFKIGPASATRDLTIFRNANPDLLIYNVAEKGYEIKQIPEENHSEEVC